MLKTPDSCVPNRFSWKEQVSVEGPMSMVSWCCQWGADSTTFRMIHHTNTCTSTHTPPSHKHTHKHTPSYKYTHKRARRHTQTHTPLAIYYLVQAPGILQQAQTFIFCCKLNIQIFDSLLFSQKGKQFNTGIGFTIDFLYFHPPVFNSLSGHRGKKIKMLVIFHFITKQFKLAYSLEKWKHVLKSYDYMFK